MTGLWRGGTPLLLASKSGARRGLLAATGIPFDTCDAMIDERGVEESLRSGGAAASAVALHLARAKALSVAVKRAGRLVLGADQTLSIGASILSKPTDRQAAAAQLKMLSGATHELHSALCLARDGVIIFEAVPSARMTVRPLSPTFIKAYLDKVGDAVLSSVGAYQAEGVGVHLFERIEGDHSTILGLPLLPLLSFLREEGYLLA
jgi:septum formation protein